MTNGPYDQPTTTVRSRPRSPMTAARSSAHSRPSVYCSASSGASDIPWPRRSKATSRNSSASALSYCLAQHRWFCDKPWMNRIGGPSAWPHSRTCSRRPPPPVIEWIFICRLPADGLCTTADIPRASSNRGSMGSWPSRGPGRVGSGTLSLPGDLLTCPSRGAYSAVPAADACVILTAMVALPGEVLVGRGRELAEFERVLDAARAGRGSTVLVAGEAGIGKTRLAAEFARRARDAGFEVLLGRSIDLVGADLPYQPFADALRPLGQSLQVDARTAGSQLRVFEESLALLVERSVAAPVLLTLEDLHWADATTLDLVAFLAHNLADRRVLLVATYRADEPSSTDRMHRLAGGVGRSGSALALDLGPLTDEDLAALLLARVGASQPAAQAEAIIARSE